MGFLLPPPTSFSYSPSFEDRKRLGVAQRRKGGNFKSKSRYSSLHFLIQGFFSPAFFSSSCHCLKALAERFAGSLVAHPSTPGLALGAIRTLLLTARSLASAKHYLENARCCWLSVTESRAGEMSPQVSSLSGTRESKKCWQLPDEQFQPCSVRASTVRR